VKVLWTEAALSQLQAIHDYIAHTSLDYASRMIDRLTQRSIQISDFPYSGRMVPEYELNEIREVLEWPFRIIYLIQPDKSQIEVLAVVHGARSHPGLSIEKINFE
jgi:plasmid stabilization system protein ParE